MKDDHFPQDHESLERKFSQLEENLTACSSPVELLTDYLSAVGERFHVPYVWLSLILLPETSALIREAQKSPFLSPRLCLIEKERFMKIVGTLAHPLLANSNLKPFYALLPPKNKYFLKSICIAPLRLRGQVIGSLNHADHCPFRYRPDMDYSLLEDLLHVVSYRLEKLVTLRQP